MATTAIYQHRSDDDAQNATVSVATGTPDTAYPPSLLVDGDPAHVAKITSTSGSWLLTFSGAQRIDIVALIHHNFDAGANVKIQANTSSSFASPAFEVSFTIPTWLGSGTSLWPVNPWLDLTAQVGYSATGWQYWRLVVSSNSQNLQLGQIWCGSSIRRFSRNFDLGFIERRRKLVVEHVTAHGVEAIASRGTTLWAMQFKFAAMDNTFRADLQAHWENVDGRRYPWLFVPNGAVNACYYVRWQTTEEELERILTAYSRGAFAVAEVGRGLRPGT